MDEAVRKSGFHKIPVILLSRPDVQAAIEKTWKNQLKTDIARCKKILMSFVEDEACSKSIRVDAAKTLYSWLGKDMQNSGLDKPPSEMSGDELRQAVDKLHREMGLRAAGANTIDGHSAPIEYEHITQGLDILQ